MDASFNIITSNIRFDNPADGIHTWSSRREVLAKILNSHKPAILATQEGRQPQLKDLEQLLPDLEIIDRHRLWIDERMYPCLYVDTKQFTIKESGDIWLSETPEIAGSHSFGTAFPRLCTWARLEGFGRQWLTISTHLDHVESSTRIRQADVLVQEIEKIRLEHETVILFGDFNDSPHSDTHRLLTRRLALSDTWQGPEETSHHPFSGEHAAGARIDWILMSDEKMVQTSMMDKTQEDGKWPSDHFPIVCRLKP